VTDPEIIESVISDEVGSSALFAARFRENAARALLLPRRDPETAVAALATADAVRTTSDSGCAVSGVPDRARDHAGMSE
jgi:Lhr-like helicase